MKRHLTDNRFKAAQKLFSEYSILADGKELKNLISSILGIESLALGSSLETRGIINAMVMKYYPNEAVIKASFIDNILAKLSNHVVIFEMNVHPSRTDLCKINGHSTVYEIKTDLDSIARLDKQINDYSSVFEEIFLICSQQRYALVTDKLPAHVGVYTYRMNRNGKINFVLKKKAQRNNCLDAKRQLKSLTTQELMRTFSSVKSSDKSSIIESILNSYSANEIHERFKTCLKLRYSQRWKFLCMHKSSMFQIDYQWFYNNPIEPKLIYNR